MSINFPSKSVRIQSESSQRGATNCWVYCWNATNLIAYRPTNLVFPRSTTYYQHHQPSNSTRFLSLGLITSQKELDAAKVSEIVFFILNSATSLVAICIARESFDVSLIIKLVLRLMEWICGRMHGTNLYYYICKVLI